jgi:lysophospholipase L1-like esterase
MFSHSPQDTGSVTADRIPDRRAFLTGFGLAVCGAAVAADPKPSLLAAAQQQPSKKRGPAPVSGIERIKELLARKEPVTWVFTGDSITHGALHTKGWRSYPEHFAERVRWELKRMRDIVINTGVSGDRAQGLLPDLDWRVLHLKPDVVSVMLAINDSAYGPVARELFRKDLTAIVAKITAAGAIPVLNTPNTVYIKNAPTQGDLAAYAQVVRDVAKATKSVLIDHYARWETVKPDQEALLAWLDDKSIHPGYLGHRELARQIFREFDIFDEQSPTCQLEVP